LITGVILAICAASGFAGSAVFIKLSLQKIPYSGATIMSLVVSALFSLSVAAILHFDEIIQLSPISFLWFAIVGVITFTGGRSLQYLAINHMGAARSSSLVACSPFFAAILAVVFLGESINIWLILGTTLIVSGVVLVSLSSEKNE
tara:strand:+ start:8384 stop:8821 length:438 start_codon:yes stop_codon:yes gene_type:complete